MVRVTITKDIQTEASQAGAPRHAKVNGTKGQTLEVDEGTANWLVQNGYATREDGTTAQRVPETTEADVQARHEGKQSTTDAQRRGKTVDEMQRTRSKSPPST